MQVDSQETSDGPARLSPLQHSTVAERAYRQIREALMEGRFEPGAVLTIQGLAKALGTSVMPIREAVTRLVAEGALEAASGRSSRVPALTAGRLVELCEVRILLEGRAAELAARHATKHDLQIIEEWHARMQKAVQQRDTDEVLHCNREFHFAIYGAARHQLLFQTIEPLWLRSGPYFRAVFNDMAGPAGKSRKSMVHHSAAIQAVRRHRPAQARLAIAADINESAAWYRSQLEHQSRLTP